MKNDNYKSIDIKFPIVDAQWSDITHIILNGKVYEWNNNKIGRELNKSEIKEFFTIYY